MQAQCQRSILNFNPHTPKREPNCKPHQGAVQKGSGAAIAVEYKESFPMRSLASVLVPRQRQGGSGPEPAANPSVQVYDESARALATEWADVEPVRLRVFEQKSKPQSRKYLRLGSDP